MKKNLKIIFKFYQQVSKKIIFLDMYHLIKDIKFRFMQLNFIPNLGIIEIIIMLNIILTLHNFHKNYPLLLFKNEDKE